MLDPIDQNPTSAKHQKRVATAKKWVVSCFGSGRAGWAFGGN